MAERVRYEDVETGEVLEYEDIGPAAPAQAAPVIVRPEKTGDPVRDAAGQFALDTAGTFVEAYRCLLSGSANSIDRVVGLLDRTWGMAYEPALRTVDTVQQLTGKKVMDTQAILTARRKAV